MLRGKTALLQEREGGRVVAQFDDLTLAPWCYGWHEFGRHEFILVPDSTEGADEFYDDHSRFKYLEVPK